jgi:hypothetical protein
MLRRLETFAFFLAMMLAVTLEGACVYWMSGHSVRYPTADSSLSFAGGEWTGFALPQGWLLGALLVLIYRITVMLRPPKRWGHDDLLHNQRAFLRLWRWAMALVAMQGLALYLERVVATS